MADFYATYSAASASGDTVTVLQGTDPWIVAGDGTAGSPSSGVVSIQGVPGGEPVEISGSITAENDSVSATGAAVPADATFVGGTDGTNLRGLKTDANGELQVDVLSSALPSGAATETTLSSINTKTPALGQAAMAASVPVVIANNQSAVPVSGSITVSGTVTANAGTGTFTTDQIASTTATFQDGSMAFGSLTTNYQTIVTAGGALKNVTMRNNTNAVIVVSLNSGAADSITLDSGDAVSWDLKPMGLNIPSTTTLQAKYSGSAPTSGSIRINGVY